MTSEPAHVLSLLRGTGRTVADPSQDVRGRQVRDVSGESLGTVDDLLVDAGADRVRMLRISHGGLLGFGAEVSLLPIEAVTKLDEDELVVDQTRDRVASAPVYDPELTDQSGYYDHLYGYYGYVPYWMP